MEGDIKDIVLTRLESRLKDKDEEIRALKDRIEGFEGSEGRASLEKRVEALEDEVRLTQATLTEVMKKLASLEAVLTSALAAGDEDGEAEASSDPDLLLDGQSEPEAPEQYDIGVGAQGPGGEKREKDALSFFRPPRNT